MKFVYQNNFNDLTLVRLYLIIIYYLNVMEINVSVDTVSVVLDNEEAYAQNMKQNNLLE